MRKHWYWFLLVMVAVLLVACSEKDTKEEAADAETSDGETKAVTAEGGNN